MRSQGARAGATLSGSRRMARCVPPRISRTEKCSATWTAHSDLFVEAGGHHRGAAGESHMTCPHRGSGVRRLAHAATVHRTHPEQIALLPHEGRARSMFVADATRTNGEGSFSSSSASTPAVAAKRRRPERRTRTYQRADDSLQRVQIRRYTRGRACPHVPSDGRFSPSPTRAVSALSRSRHSSYWISPTTMRCRSAAQPCSPSIFAFRVCHAPTSSRADLQADYLAVIGLIRWSVAAR